MSWLPRTALLAALSVVGSFGQITSSVGGAVANGAVTNADNSFSAAQTMPGLSVTGTTATFGTAGTTGYAKWDGTNHYVGVYDSGNALFYGISSGVPGPTGTTTIGGYYKGMGVGGSTSGGSNPIFGVLTSTQSGNGLGATALTVYDTNVVTTFNNTIDDGFGNAIVRNPVAAVSGTNQSGPTTIWRQSYFNVSALNDDWKLTPSIGTGTTPTSTWTLGYTGSSGVHSIALRAPVAITNAGANTTLTVANWNGITESFSANLPTIAAGTGAGTTPTVALVAGSHTNGGSFTVTTGTTPTASATVATVTFNTATGTVPANSVFCVIAPANVATAALSGTAAVFVSSASSTTSFVATVGSSALAASTAYAWNYSCQ